MTIGVMFIVKIAPSCFKPVIVIEVFVLLPVFAGVVPSAFPERLNDENLYPSFPSKTTTTVSPK